MFWEQRNIQPCTYMYSEQRIYNYVHICVLNKEYTTMYIYVLWTENIQQCTYMCSKQRIYNNVHIWIVNREYTTMYIYVLWTENIQQCTYMCSKQKNIQPCTYLFWEQRIYNNVHICIVNREYTTMYIYVF